MMKSWLGFGDLDLLFKVTAGLQLPNLSQKVFVCAIFHQLVGRFQPDLHRYNNGTWLGADLVLVTLTYFSRSLRDLNCKIWANRYLCAQYLMNQLADLTTIVWIWHLNMMKSWIGFDDLDLIFKITARLNPPNLSQIVVVCMLSHGPLDGMLPNLQAYINRTGPIAY